MNIRKANMDDVAGLALVHVASWQAAYRGVVPDSTLDQLDTAQFEERWRRRLAFPARETLVCDVDGRIAGFASTGPSRDEQDNPRVVSELYAIYVSPQDWSTGLGGALWRHARASVAERGFREVIVWVLRANQRARKFYEYVGFQLEPESYKEARMVGGTFEEVRYRLHLDT